MNTKEKNRIEAVLEAVCLLDTKYRYDKTLTALCVELLTRSVPFEKSTTYTKCKVRDEGDFLHTMLQDILERAQRANLDSNGIKQPEWICFDVFDHYTFKLNGKTYEINVKEGNGNSEPHSGTRIPTFHINSPKASLRKIDIARKKVIAYLKEEKIEFSPILPILQEYEKLVKDDILK